MKDYVLYDAQGRAHSVGSIQDELDPLDLAPPDVVVEALYPSELPTLDCYVDLSTAPPTPRPLVDSGVQVVGGTLSGLPSSGELTMLAPYYETYSVSAGDVELDTDEPGRYVFALRFDDPQYRDWRGEAIVQ